MNKGFTLIELLAVIVIIAVISVITVPATLSSVRNTRLGSLKETENAIVRATESFLTINNAFMPVTVGESYKISIDDLKTHNYIKNVSDYGSNCNGFVDVIKLNNMNLDFYPYINCSTGYATQDLVAYYDFDTDALDKTYNNRNGTLSNVSFVEDGINKVGYFDGTSQVTFSDIYSNSSPNRLFAGISPATLGNNNESVTYMGWAKPTTVDATARSLFDDGNLGEGTVRFYSNRIYVVWGGTNAITYNMTVNPNQWYHIVMTHEHNSTLGQYILNLYIDGVLRGTSSVIISAQAGFYGPDTPMRVGNNFIGYIDEIKLFNKVFTSDEVLEEYNRTRHSR
jgi:prepilin-type N-terminal cleavage/methylation domain-containing protein